MRSPGPYNIAFGTSGLRAPADAFDAVFVSANVSVFLTHVAIAPGTEAFVGCNFRASSPEISTRVFAAIAHAVLAPHWCGVLPTPALAAAALARGVPAIIITGSHILESYNCIKFYKSNGEFLKSDEAPILSRLKLGVFEHSAAGRDLLADILAGLNAECDRFGRSETFVADDPERYAAPIVITNEDYRFLIAGQAHECGVELAAILLEPVARNTAAAIAAACFVATNRDPEALLHVLPSDHEIAVDETYLHAVNTASAAARDGQLTTFSITPSEPAIGFGYIEAGDALPFGARVVNRFVEKPMRAKAEKMLASGNYDRNSGMFLFRASAFLGECETLAPEVHAAAKGAVAHCVVRSLRLGRGVEGEPARCLGQSDAGPGQSFQYNWFAGVFRKPTHRGRRARGCRRHCLRGCGLCRQAVGCAECRRHCQGAACRRIDLGPYRKASDRLSLLGGYASLISGDRFQVKRIFVKPGKRLSLQKHHHRSEHWIIVRGTAEVQVGKAVSTLTENESVYFPQGEIHRLTNPGKIELELIEVQTGSYLGEDDIIRLDNEFGRV